MDACTIHKDAELKPSLHGPQCNDCCPFCWATKEEFLLPTFTGAKSLTLADWIAMSPVPEVLRLVKHENDIGLDARQPMSTEGGGGVCTSLIEELQSAHQYIGSVDAHLEY